MKLKQKVIRILITILCTIVLAAGGYLAIFIVKDTLSPPPPPSLIDNLFVAKNRIDIERLNTTKNINECNIGYDNISLSLKEDKINDFVTDEQYKSLNEELNFAFTERFIALAYKYFEQSEWDKNDLVNKIIIKIRNKGFVEQHTPIWNLLQSFEDNISCYNEMKKCLSNINAISGNLRNYIPVDEIFSIKNQKQILENRDCVKNRDVESELLDSYVYLERQAKEYARLTVTPATHLEYDPSGGSKTISVNTNVSPWFCSNAYPWLSIKKSGSSLLITCQPNPEIYERTTGFDITAWEKTVKITVKQKANVSRSISGTIDKVWVETNEHENGRKGMKIHIKFSVNGLLNRQGNVNALFYYSSGVPVTYKKNGTSSTDHVTVSRPFYPKFENATFNDFVLFMPYGDFHLAKGTHPLKFTIGILDRNNQPIANSNYFFFDINQP